MLRFAFLSTFLATAAAADDFQILPGYSDFGLPEMALIEQPMTLVTNWVAGFPDSVEGRPTLSLTSEMQDGILVIEITETGLADDSVSAVQRRYELAPTDDWQWQMVAYGHHQQCYRVNPGQWHADPCL